MAEPSKPPPPDSRDLDTALSAHAGRIAGLYAQSSAARWGVSPDSFRAALGRCLAKALPGAPDVSIVARVLDTLHMEDLVLSCACAEGQEAAWEHFVATYRGYLRSAAQVIVGSAGGSLESFDLADSLFADLYGVAEGKPGHGSLFRYFHGRSSLRTWLRAVLAQRHIDRIRATRRFTDLEDGQATSAIERSARPAAMPLDPNRERYLRMLRQALHSALAALDPGDRKRLELYYREEQTLREIGRIFGEHESSVSRHLERVRRSLRAAVESSLRLGFPAANGSPAERGLGDAEIALCLEYAAEDGGLNLDVLFPPGPSAPGATQPMPTPARKRP